MALATIELGGSSMLNKSLRAFAAFLGILVVVTLTHSNSGFPFFSSPAFAEENPSVTFNYRSIGTHTGNLAGGDSSTASVGQGLTAVTFAGVSLSADIGIGDKLTLDPSGVNEVGYVFSRDSANQVTLQGAVQNDHSVGVSYAITRSYNLIQAWENDRQGDLVADNRREAGVAYNDGPFNETVLD